MTTTCRGVLGSEIIIRQDEDDAAVLSGLTRKVLELQIYYHTTGFFSNFPDCISVRHLCCE